LQNDQFSFIVHIWREAEDREDNGSAWRGSIDDVSSHKRLYFNDLDGITRFIEEQVGSIANKSSLHWTTRLANKGEYLFSQIHKKFSKPPKVS
jgi:hypothetical protein